MLEQRMKQENDDEFDLRNILLMLWTRKWIFVGTVLTTMILGVGAAWKMPNIYKAFIVIEPGVIEITPEGRYIYLDSAQNIKGKIDSNVYEQRVREEVGDENSTVSLRFSVDVPKNSNLIKISKETTFDNIDLSFKCLLLLVQELQNDYQMNIERRISDLEKQKKIYENDITEILIKKKDFDTQISQARNDVKEMDDKIKSLQHSLAVLKSRETELLEDISQAHSNTEKLILERNKFIEKQSDRGLDLSSILYTTTIQQNMSFVNDLQSQLQDLRMKISEMMLEINTISGSKARYEIQIRQLELQKTEQQDMLVEGKNIELFGLERKKLYIQNIKIVGKPFVTAAPIKPDRRMIVVLFSLAGCILGFIVSSFVDYSQKIYIQRWKSSNNGNIA